MENILAPSILAADFKVLGEQLKCTEAGGAKYIHFDVMDGMFVPGISFGLPVLSSIRGFTGQLLDLHLMVAEPIRCVEFYVNNGADIITVHYEACKNLEETIDEIHACGVRAGVCINPLTPVHALIPYLEQADSFLIMSVQPGAGGQPFIPETYARIRRLRKWLNERGIDADIEVDGGIRLDNAASVLDAGANILVSGSAVFSGDVLENTRQFMEVLGSR